MKIETKYSINELIWTKNKRTAGFVNHICVYLDEKNNIRIEYILKSGIVLNEDEVTGMGDS